MEAALKPVEQRLAAPAAAPPRGRRRHVPNDLSLRLEQAAPDRAHRSAARQVDRTLKELGLQGFARDKLTADELSSVFVNFDAEDKEYVEAGWSLLESVAYGQPQGRKPRSERACGSKRAQRANPGKCPRALALRAPTHPKRTGRNDGEDRYGPVKSSETLRPRDLGLVAFALGEGFNPSPDGPYTETTTGMLAHLTRTSERRDPGGRDLRDVRDSLLRLAQLELHAPPPKKLLKGSDPRDFEIPCTPVRGFRVQYPDGNWSELIASATEYEAFKAESFRQEAELSDEAVIAASEKDANEPAAARGTLRIYWHEWATEAVTYGRHTVWIHPIVWTYRGPEGERLGQLGQRIYLFLQASAELEYDETVGFYTADQQRFTLGLTGRSHRDNRRVAESFRRLREADGRYHKPRSGGWRIGHRHAGTKYRGFYIFPIGKTRPTEEALAGARMPAVIRFPDAATARKFSLEKHGHAGGHQRRGRFQAAAEAARGVVRQTRAGPSP